MRFSAFVPAALACLGMAVGASAQVGSPLAQPDVLEAMRAQAAPAEAPSTSLEGAIDPEEYMLGPGDLLEIGYTGASQPAERLRVTPSGRIHLRAAGPVQVAGLTLAEAESDLRGILSRYYADTRITVDLVEVRTFRVHLLGHVIGPGTFTMSATDRASDLLDRPDSLQARASLRNLVLRRRGGDEVPVDLARYRLLGDLSANPYLEDGDVLIVRPQRDSVSVFGRVARPGFLEFRTGDTIHDLVELAGGFDPGADTTEVELRRFDPVDPERSTTETLDLSGPAGGMAAQPGDGVYIRARPNWRKERLVEIWGEVRYPGVYAIEKGQETLRTLVGRAGGFTDDADPSGTQVFRPDVFDRPEEDPEFLRLQAIPITQMTHEEFEYLKLRSRQREGLASSVLSDVLTAREGGLDLVLRSGDQVRVPEQNHAVDVQGAVKNPGFVPWQPSLAPRDYVELAGGKTERARTGRMRVIRARTGERLEAGARTRVDPGDMVWIPEKPHRDWWKIVRETAVFVAQIGTVIVIVDSVNNP